MTTTAVASLTRPEVRVALMGGVAVVSLLGEHDLATAAELRNTLGSLLEQKAEIVVDLSECEFIDSSVIYALVDGTLLASEHRSRISFQLKPDTAVHRVLEICGLLKIWPVYGSRDEALAALPEASALWPRQESSVSSTLSPRRCLSALVAGKPWPARRQPSQLEVT